MALGPGPKIITVVCTIISIGAVVTVLCWNYHVALADFPQFITAGRLFLAGRGAEVYDHLIFGAEQHKLYPNMDRNVVHFGYAPYALPFLIPIALVPPWMAIWVWQAAGISCLLGSVQIYCKLYNIEKPIRNRLLFMASILGPFLHVIVMGQPSYFYLFGISLGIWFLKGGKNLLAGIALCALLPKPHLLLPFLVYLAGAGRYIVLLPTVILGAVLVAISYLLIGTEGYQDYATDLQFMTTHHEFMRSLGCITVRTQLLRLWPEQYFLNTAVSGICWLAALIFLFIIGRKFSKDNRWIEAGLLVALPLGFVTAPYIQPYDMVLWLPSVLMLTVVPFGQRYPRFLKELWIFYFATLFFPAYVPVHLNKLPVYSLFWICVSYVWVTVINVIKNAPTRAESPTETDSSSNATIIDGSAT